MFPNWHGKSYLRRIAKHYGLVGLWHQFWYDVRNWSVQRRK
jgi:hypothetical protein